MLKRLLWAKKAFLLTNLFMLLLATMYILNQIEGVYDEQGGINKAPFFVIKCCILKGYLEMQY